MRRDKYMQTESKLINYQFTVTNYMWIQLACLKYTTVIWIMVQYHPLRKKTFSSTVDKNTSKTTGQADVFQSHRWFH